MTDTTTTTAPSTPDPNTTPEAPILSGYIRVPADPTNIPATVALGRDCKTCRRLVFRNTAGDEVNLCRTAGMPDGLLEFYVIATVIQVPVPPCLPGWPEAWFNRNQVAGLPGPVPVLPVARPK